MKIQLHEKGDAVVIAAEGQITFEEVADLRSQFDEAWQRRRRAVLLDLSAVEYLDSTGIAALVEGLKAAQRAGRAFGLCGLRKNVRNVIELVRLDTFFNIYDNEEVALEELTKRPSEAPTDSPG